MAILNYRARANNHLKGSYKDYSKKNILFLIAKELWLTHIANNRLWQLQFFFKMSKEKDDRISCLSQTTKNHKIKQKNEKLRKKSNTKLFIYTLQIWNPVLSTEVSKKK